MDSALLLPVELHKSAFKSLKTLWRTQKCAPRGRVSSMRHPRPQLLEVGREPAVSIVSKTARAAWALGAPPSGSAMS
jgi:hypothetical protein